jgi:hypothetical protein
MAPDEIPQDIWDAANALPIVSENFDDGDLAIIARALLAERMGERSRAIAACEKQKASFASDEYATPQPLGGLMERFACDMCIDAIRTTRADSK